MTFCPVFLVSEFTSSYNLGMVRPRCHLRCDVCGTEPDFRDERFFCLCPKFQWIPKRGYSGTATDRALLGRYTWGMVSDGYGFVYWLGPGNRGVVYLYEDGTWAGGSERFDDLEDYLAFYARCERWRRR